MLRLIVLCVLFVFVHSETTIASRCLNYDAELPVNQYVLGCITPPCLLPQKQDVVIDVVFRPPRTISTMRTLATAFVNFVIGSVAIPYDLGPTAVTCNFLTNTYCPVLKDETVLYTLRMYISEIFPTNLPVIVEFRVVDDNEDAIWCIRLPIMVTGAVETSYGTSINKTLSTNV